MRASSGRGGWSSATPSNAPEPLPSARQTRHTLAMKYEYSHDEILAEHPYERPLVLDGIPCHGGFVEGRYVSPRTLWRAPAIEAWQARLPAGELDAVLGPIGAAVPPHFPSAAQTRLLVRHGVTVPLVRLLSLIAIVEGFGGDVLRVVALPPLGARVRDPVDGTALAHLGSLFEAHARDEAGHRHMWELARDIARTSSSAPRWSSAASRITRGGRCCWRSSAHSVDQSPIARWNAGRLARRAR